MKSTHVKKKFDAFGSSWARSVGTERVLFRRLGRAAIIPAESVTIRNEC